MVSVFDRYLEDPIKLQGNLFNVTLINVGMMPSNIGRLNAYQVTLNAETRQEEKEELGLSDCTTEDRAVLDEFWGSHDIPVATMPV